MRQQKSHDINEAMRADGRRLVFTLLSVAVLVTLIYSLEQKYNFVKRLVVLPETKVESSPVPSVVTTPLQTPPATTKKPAG